MVMAGGEGTRLYPLTEQRSKPAVPFGGRYRIVDFVLSNLVNSGILSIYLLVQYKSQSLIEHVRRGWLMAPNAPRQFVTVVPPQMRVGSDWFQGTADAVYQNLNLIYDNHPDIVAVFGADHIYRMDICQMLEFHDGHKADVTVAALPVPLEEARSFGVIVAGEDGRIREFLEKPENPVPIPADPRRAYASMGNYLFNAEVLIDALRKAHGEGQHDFGRHILPKLKDTHRVFAYDFASNRVPGVKPYEEHAYWRDVGTIDAYFEAHQDLLGKEPRFDLFNPQWPIHSGPYQGPVANIIDGEIISSKIGAGTLVKGARVRNCVIRREVMLEPGVELEDCIIMDYSVIRRGSRLRRAIVDRYNVIEEGSRIGYDLARDRERYHVTESGIVVLHRGGRRHSLERAY
jgi:glucose-1-phosphate adenylyltransferase